MTDESGASGIAKGIRKSLNAQMWTGGRWDRTGDLINNWLIGAIRRTPNTCGYCRQAIAVEMTLALTEGPTEQDMEPYATVEEDA